MYVHQLTNVWIYKDKVSVLPDCVRHFACKLLTSFTPFKLPPSMEVVIGVRPVCGLHRVDI